jgi:hypothetical protein
MDLFTAILVGFCATVFAFGVYACTLIFISTSGLKDLEEDPD